jgi:hypothetical protein
MIQPIMAAEPITRRVARSAPLDAGSSNNSMMLTTSGTDRLIRYATKRLPSGPTSTPGGRPVSRFGRPGTGDSIYSSSSLVT